MKILVMKFRNIGDVLLTTPLLKNLKHYFPNANIDFALNKGTETMLENNPHIRKLHIYDRAKINNANFFKKIFYELAYANSIKKEHYDMVIQTTTGDRGIIMAKYANIKQIVSYESKSKILNKFITHKADKNGLSKHTVEANLDILKALGLTPVTKKVKLYLNADPIKDLSLPDRFIHMHLTSRWMFKCANSKIMAQIIDFCENELNIKVVMTSDNNEIELTKIKEVLKFCKSRPINLAGNLNLKQVAALSKKSSLYIGVDTAIMHMAAANDIPVIAFFGPSNPKNWGPWDNNEQKNYKKINGNQEIGKNFIFQKNWSCVPCEKDGCNGSKISRCLMEFDEFEIKQIKLKIKEKIS